MPVRALRGATTLDADTPEQVSERVRALVLEVLARNQVGSDEAISLVITATNDIHSAHPATAARSCGLDDVPILGAQELAIDGSLPLCVRLLLHVDIERTRAEVRHVFLEGAVVLRPDLAGR
jgi:chorismate mutase